MSIKPGCVVISVPGFSPNVWASPASNDLRILKSLQDNEKVLLLGWEGPRANWAKVLLGDGRVGYMGSAQIRGVAE